MSMVEIPWHDGTWREVEYDAPVRMLGGYLVYAAEGGFKYFPDGAIYSWAASPNKVTAVLTEAPEPPVKVEVPTGIGAVIGPGLRPRDTAYPIVKGASGEWFDREGSRWSNGAVVIVLREGAVVLSEGATLDD